MAIKPHERAALEVIESDRFRGQVAKLALTLGRPLEEVQKEAESALRGMVAVESRFFGMLMDGVLGALHTRAWTMEGDPESLSRLKALNEHRPLVFLPTHRSYADVFVLTKILREAGMPRNHILGGDNLSFFPFGTIARRASGIFIRRNFGEDEVYKLVVREYLRHLLASGANLEWYMEGGRSRTGKLRPPKYGLLRYLVDAFNSGAAQDALLVPVSITYGRLHELAAMAAEESGGVKPREGLRWLVSYLRKQKERIGKVYIRFGEPISMRASVERSEQDHESPRLVLEKLAFQVFQGINRVTPVTGQALVLLTLLGVDGRALSLREIEEIVEPIKAYVGERGLPTVALEGLAAESGVAGVLDALVNSGEVERYDAGLDPMFRIAPGQHGLAAFYRNSAIHWFINRAIIELAVVMAAKAGPEKALEQGRELAFGLRDLLKFEFFFSDKQVFREEIQQEAALLAPQRHRQLTKGREGQESLNEASFLIAHRVLPSFVEAYFIVADRLAAQPVDQPVDRGELVQTCIDVGRQYVLQKQVRNPESISRELFTNAISLAANRGLLEPGAPNLAERRRQFLNETKHAVAALVLIEQLDASHRQGNNPRRIVEPV